MCERCHAQHSTKTHQTTTGDDRHDMVDLEAAKGTPGIVKPNRIVPRSSHQVCVCPVLSGDKDHPKPKRSGVFATRSVTVHAD